MTFLARKITRGRWKNADPGEVARIPADAITTDLRTHQTTLSFWACHTSDPEGLTPAALAIATGSKRTRLDNIDLLWLPNEVLSVAGFEIEENDGDTALTSCVKLHRDVIVPDYERLGILAGLFAEAYLMGHIWRLRQKQQVNGLRVAYEQGDLALGKLHTDLKGKLEASWSA